MSGTSNAAPAEIIDQEIRPNSQEVQQKTIFKQTEANRKSQTTMPTSSQKNSNEPD